MSEFDRIVAPIMHELPAFPEEEQEMANMPDVTPGEGGAFALAALLVSAGLVADLSENVQIATIIGGVLLGIAGTFTTGRIRVARNDHLARKAVAEAEVIVVEEGEE